MPWLGDDAARVVIGSAGVGMLRLIIWLICGN